ncbi:conserved hypothetical protein [Mycoplasma crocodyli MP145]|uniref:tRNA-binding domain-containing protein n=1 Tax=Mycoplasma crocodyli (strain ATCC 51981 / MP145) TaxID=512564 RepID=D5E4N9_MYCCM|nr:conserved hypothetical protein [Mycoplasma crocodyli MP145]
MVFCDNNFQVHSINLFNTNKLNVNFKNNFSSVNQEDFQKIMGILLSKNSKFKFQNKTKFIYAKVLKRTIHPKSEKLFVLDLLINVHTNEVIQLVTNTLDSTEGKVLVCALPGSKVFTGMVVDEGVLIGVKSFGMLSGYETLGIKKEGLIFGKENQIGLEFEL